MTLVVFACLFATQSQSSKIAKGPCDRLSEISSNLPRKYSQEEKEKRREERVFLEMKTRVYGLV